jgi:dienelactone hydrolase
MRNIVCFLALAICTRCAFAQPSAADVSFPSGKLKLHGALWKPAGAGPFPAIVWNHGSEKNPSTKPELAAFYTSHGYVFFVPYRRGQGGSPGPYIQDLVESASRFSRSARMVELQDEDNADVVAAVNYLKSQSFVDAERMAISGCSYGGIQTLLAGEKNLGVKALIPFAPGAMSWDKASELQVRLKRAVDNAKAPIFLVQAANDFSTAPSHELGREAQFRHVDFRTKIYPPFGSTPEEGHGKFCSTATSVWGNDVLAFLDAHLGGK